MGWLKIDDAFADSPKVDNLSDGALRLWVVVACWLRQPERASLNGFVPAAALETITRRRWPAKALAKFAQELVNATVGGLHDHGLWDAVDGGWVFHDWKQFQPTDEPMSPAEKGRIGGLKSAEARRERSGTAIPTNAPNNRSTRLASVPASVEASAEPASVAHTEPAEAPSPSPKILLKPTTKDLTDPQRPEAPSVVAAANQSQKVRCPADLRLTDDQRGALETCLIPGWAIDELTSQYVSAELADETKTMPIVAWRKCLAKSISSCWNDQRRRPKRPESTGPAIATAPPTGGEPGQAWHSGGYWYFPLPEQQAAV